MVHTMMSLVFSRDVRMVFIHAIGGIGLYFMFTFSQVGGKINGLANFLPKTNVEDDDSSIEEFKK